MGKSNRFNSRELSEMSEIKYVKTVFDGQGFWLLWHWPKSWTPDRHPAPEELPKLSGGYLYASGPFVDIAEAEKAISDDWTQIPFRSAT
jgi:hypothetical protein